MVCSAQFIIPSHFQLWLEALKHIYLSTLLEVVEEEPIVKSLHRPILLLTKKHVLKPGWIFGDFLIRHSDCLPAGALDALASAVH